MEKKVPDISPDDYAALLERVSGLELALSALASDNEQLAADNEALASELERERASRDEEVVTTARECGLSPMRYVEWLLEELPLAGDLGDPAVADRYLPWSGAVPASARIPGAEVASLRAAQEEPIAEVDPGTLREDE